MERVRDVEVGEIPLGAGDPPDPADAVRGLADAARRDGHWSRPSAFERAPTRAPAAADRGGTGGRRDGPPLRAARHELDGLEDLLVARAPAEVPGQSLLDRGPARVRVRLEQRVRGHELARDAEAALDGARVEERLLDRGERAVARRQPLHGHDLGAVRLRRRGRGTRRRSVRPAARCRRRTRRRGSTPWCRSAPGRRGARRGASRAARRARCGGAR